MGTADATVRDIRNQQKLEQALNGDLVEVGDYRIQTTRSGQFKTALSPLFCRNHSVEQGDEPDTYADFSRGLYIIDFGGTISGDL